MWTRLLLVTAVAGVLVGSPTTAAGRTDTAPFGPPNDSPAVSVDPIVWRLLEAHGQVDISIVLEEQADLSGAQAMATKEEKGWHVYRQLIGTAERTQQPLRAFLDRHDVSYRSYWIRNMVRVPNADAALVRRLARQPRIDRIDTMRPAELVSIEFEPIATDHRTSAVEWNIQRVRADDVWNLGYDGDGVVVGVIDSGADWDHPALINAYRSWIPGAPTRHDYNWYDGPTGSPVPVDYSGHGTAVTGIIVGDDGGLNQIGMAPGSDWIGCAMIGGHSIAADCLQFMLAPTRLDGSDPRPDLAPDVISNSWRSREDFSDIIHTLYLAGIMFIKAGENDGPLCTTVYTPGHLREVTAVGAFAQGDLITSFSSRGPMSVDGELVVKPDLAAPGQDCRTSSNGGGYTNSNGTSVACPHVAGAVALMLSARPDLSGRVDTLQTILTATAEPRFDSQCSATWVGDRPNNVWGYGILNAHDAVSAALSLGMGDIEGQVTEEGSGLPIAAARIRFEDDAGREFLGTDVTGGDYGHTLPAGTYTVAVEAYGYDPQAVAGVVVASDDLTIRDLSLTVQPTYLVSGTVTDNSESLTATVTVPHTPLPPIQTDPDSGFYSFTVAEGVHTLQVESFQYLSDERTFVVDQDQTQDFSLDRIPFIPHAANPVLEPGAPGEWDSGGIGGPSVVQHGGVYYMFYMGASATNLGAIGYATSPDGVNFTKHPANPVLAGDGTGFDASFAGYPVILHTPDESDSWTLYYAGWATGGQWGVGRATAPTPSGPWTRTPDSLLSPGGFWEWDGEYVLLDSVIRTAFGYVMYYTGDSNPGVSARIGRATSPDGLVWTKYDDPSTPDAPFAASDPVLWGGPPETFDHRILNFCDVRNLGGVWEMFYGGWDTNLSYLATGYATSPDGVHWTKFDHSPILHPKDDPMATQWLRHPAFVQASSSGSPSFLYHDYGGGAIGVAVRADPSPAANPKPSSR